MTDKEREFWFALRFGITESEAFNAYCDWIEPKRYILTSPIATIKGKIGFLTHEIEVFNFILSIPNKTKDASEIDWKGLMLMKLREEDIFLNGDTVEIELS